MKYAMVILVLLGAFQVFDSLNSNVSNDTSSVLIKPAVLESIEMEDGFFQTCKEIKSAVFGKDTWTQIDDGEFDVVSIPALVDDRQCTP